MTAVYLQKLPNVIFVSLFLKSKSSLDQMESQSADAEPPPPPKPELRYPGFSRTDTEGLFYFLNTVNIKIKYLSFCQSNPSLSCFNNVFGSLKCKRNPPGDENHKYSVLLIKNQTIQLYSVQIKWLAELPSGRPLPHPFQLPTAVTICEPIGWTVLYYIKKRILLTVFTYLCLWIWLHWPVSLCFSTSCTRGGGKHQGGVGGTLEGGRVLQIFCQCIATCQEGTNCFNNWLYSVIGNAWMTFFVLREQPFDWSSTHTINVSVQTRLQQPRKKPHCPYTP